MSDPDGWRALEELYQAALEREPAEREAFLAESCSNPELRAQVRSLLRAQAAGDRLLEQPAAACLSRPLGRGAMIGQYRIEERIGSGGMGDVYRATDTRLRRAVAIKTLPAVYASDPDMLAAFERESRLLAKFNHPYIASIYGVEAGALVMELVPGPTLAERIARGPIPAAEAIPVIRQIAEAIDYAHDRGVIHRDLKPANIKYTDASGDRVKVLDFGIGKALESASTASVALSRPGAGPPATVRGAVKGTAAYMSPEQARGEGVDQRADLWALGAVIFEMLTGRALFGRSTAAQSLDAVQNAPIDLGAIAPPLRRILEHCLVRDSRTRWRSASHVVRELDRTSRSAPARFASRLPWILAAVFAIIAAIALLGWWRSSR
jgi:serine/threonine-protein kinase